MTLPAQTALESLARRVAVSVQQTETVLALLDEGHSPSFIARYRRDRTQGLDEAVVRRIKHEAHLLRLLEDRRQAILKSIESQGKLDDLLQAELVKAETLSRLEDLYLPYKPRKQSLAEAALSRSLHPLAEELLDDAPASADLDQRLPDFISPERGLQRAGDVLLNVGHLLAELISYRADIRSLLRQRYLETARVVSRRAKPTTEKSPATAELGAKGAAKPSAKAAFAPLSPAADAAVESTVPDEPDADVAHDHDVMAELERELEDQHTESSGTLGEEHEPVSGELDESATFESGVSEPGLISESTSGELADSHYATHPALDAAHEPQTTSVPGTSTLDSTAASQTATESQPPTSDASGISNVDVEPNQEMQVAEAPTESVQADLSAESGPAATLGGESPSAAQLAAEHGSGQAGLSVAAEGVGAEGAGTDPLEGFQFPAPQPFPVPDASGIGIETGLPHHPPVVISAPPMTKSAARKQAAKAAKERKRERLERVFQEFFKYNEQLAKVPLHRLLGLLRGERVRVLQVAIEADIDALCQIVEPLLIPDNHRHANLLRGCLRDAIVKLILPSLEREVRRQWNDRVEQHVIDVFARNLRPMLLQQPLKRKIAAVTCDARGNGRLIVLDADGRVLQHDSVRFWAPVEEIEASRQKLIDTIRQQAIEVIAIGNGATCRRIEHLVADVLSKELQDVAVQYAIVNEAGCAVYATSALGREELPDLDSEARAAVSLGRRLLDPLAEFTKIPPTNLNAGRYQAELKAKHLREQIEEIVSSLVNEVGLDINQANPATLCYVAGLNQLTARRLYDRRMEQGPFQTREQFKETTGFTPEVFVEAAGFLRVMSGENPLDAGWIHPDHYAVAERLLAKLQSGPELLRQILLGGESGAAARKQLATASDRLDWSNLASELNASEGLIRDLLYAFRNLGRDPRDHATVALLRRGLLRFEDLQPGVELQGTVLNVAPFGVFVDVGLSDSALVHISRLSSQYVQDPHDVAAPGDAIRVWVHSVDTEKRRVALTAIDPRSRRREPPAAKPARQAPPSRPAAGTESQGPRTARPPRKPARPATPPPKRSVEVKPKAKPVKPITKAMVEGKEPLRSFSDLLQFMDRKTEKPNSEEKSN